MSAATVFEDAQSGDEGSLDAAFEAVEITARFYSTAMAEAVSERWLWGASWKRVAGMLGCSRQFAFDRCIACFGWMDRNIVFEDGGARYVGAGKSSIVQRVNALGYTWMQVKHGEVETDENGNPKIKSSIKKK